MALDDKEQAALEAKLKAAEDDAEKWKELSKKHEKRATENHTELEQLKSSGLSDQQKREAAEKAAADKLAEFEKKLADETKARMRAEVAAAKGLTPAQAKRLSGNTQEELEADAADLLENFPSADKGDNSGKENGRPATRPKTEVTGGGDPTGSAAVETDPTKLAADLPRY